MLLHSSDPYILFTLHAVVKRVNPCLLPKEALISGAVVAKITEQNTNPIKISSKGTLTLFSDKLEYGTHEAHLEADAEVEINGPNAGPWGAH